MDHVFALRHSAHGESEDVEVDVNDEGSDLSPSNLRPLSGKWLTDGEYVERWNGSRQKNQTTVLEESGDGAGRATGTTAGS